MWHRNFFFPFLKLYLGRCKHNKAEGKENQNKRVWNYKLQK